MPSQTSTWTGWALATGASAVAAPGAFLTCDAGRTPIAVVRGQDGTLRAFVNMCRHRGMALLSGCGQIESTVACPYHAWRFDTTGRLKVIPQKAQFPGIDPADWNLLPAGLTEWAGLVLVHEDPAATAPALPPQDASSSATFEVQGAFDVQDWDTGAAPAARDATSVLSIEVSGSLAVLTSVHSASPGTSTVRVGVTTTDGDALPRAVLEARGHVAAAIQRAEASTTTTITATRSTR